MTPSTVERRVREWKYYISTHPGILKSSLVEPYINNQPYRDIESLGRDALPYLMEELTKGEFLLNQAVIVIASLNREDLLPDPDSASEQEISNALLAWWERQISM